MQMRTEQLLTNSQIDKPKRIRPPLCSNRRTHEIPVQLNTGILMNPKKVVDCKVIIGTRFLFSSRINIIHYLVIVNISVDVQIPPFSDFQLGT